jgi:hypothetical protein
MRLAATPDAASELSSLDQAFDAVKAADLHASEARKSVDAQRLVVELAEAAAVADRQRLLDMRESESARRFFHTLDPTMCPRCDTAITGDRRHDAAATHTCPVCTSRLDTTTDDMETSAENAAQSQEEQTELAEQAAVDARQVLDELSAGLTAALRDRDQARTRLEQLAAHRATIEARRQMELERAVLLGRLEEREQVIAPPGVDDATTELAVLRAAQEEAEQRLRSAAGSLFDELNAEVLRLGQRFGIEALESAEVKRNGQMPLRKGGENTSFGRVTRGERLRLKVAVVIAMLRVGQRTGVGRHPGLLLIDSPGADETEPADVTSILRELASIATELSHLQILTTSAQADLVLDVLDPEHVVVADEGEPLW